MPTEYTQEEYYQEGAHVRAQYIARKDRDSLLFKRLLFVLGDEALAIKTLGVFEYTCKHCWDDDDDCACWENGTL